jgi:hypothetical protein
MKFNRLHISFLFLITVTSFCFGGKNKKKSEHNANQNKKEYVNNITDIQAQEDARREAQTLINMYCIETNTLKFRDVKKSIRAICKVYPDIICRQKASSHRIYTLAEKNAKTAEIAAHDDTDEFKFGTVNSFLFDLIVVGSKLSHDSLTMPNPITKNKNKKNS